jgi:D-alanine-D-alanine ligase
MKIFSSPAMSILHSLRCTGTFGEDGQLQELLEQRGVAYTGEGVEGSWLAFDKIRSKEKFEEQRVRTPEWETIEADQQPRMQLPIV